MKDKLPKQKYRNGTRLAYQSCYQHNDCGTCILVEAVWYPKDGRYLYKVAPWSKGVCSDQFKWFLEEELSKPNDKTVHDRRQLGLDL